MRRKLIRFASITILLSIFLTVSSLWAKDLRIGYFGGTFDPITRGHKSLVTRAILAAQLDIVYVFPSITNSIKQNVTPYDARKHMVELAFHDMPAVKVPDEEMEHAFNVGRATEVLRLLFKRTPQAKIFRISGDDVISRNLNTELITDAKLNNVGFIIGERAGENQKIAEDLKQFDFSGRKVIILPASTDEGISSSQARKLVHTDVPLQNIPLEPSVLAYIHHQKLYPQITEATYAGKSKLCIAQLASTIGHAP